MAPSSTPKTAVVTLFGLWEFLRMPFGLKNAAQSFQRLMDGILRDIPFAFLYLDDILVASRSSQEHAQHLEQLFKLLSADGLVINKAKYIFGAEELDFLGHHVSAIGIAPLPDRVAALRDSKPPQNRTGLQRFLGIINYYHRFLPGLAPILAPLHAQASGARSGTDIGDNILPLKPVLINFINLPADTCNGYCSAANSRREVACGHPVIVTVQ
ncbi:Pol polyprotein [Plakobranchus ocellatus]|uniref:Pol polyprotein n=1 Tax=Plakobranchus ocellatus TaxID=259542 RepID=A0AAV4CW49_9GAST|nr:Pol polyprotein [Plakobranchus ocellatus]